MAKKVETIKRGGVAYRILDPDLAVLDRDGKVYDPRKPADKRRPLPGKWIGADRAATWRAEAEAKDQAAAKKASTKSAETKTAKKARRTKKGGKP